MQSKLYQDRQKWVKEIRGDPDDTLLIAWESLHEYLQSLISKGNRLREGIGIMDAKDFSIEVNIWGHWDASPQVRFKNNGVTIAKIDSLELGKLEEQFLDLVQEVNNDN